MVDGRLGMDGRHGWVGWMDDGWWIGDGWADGDGWMEGMDGWMDGWMMDGCSLVGCVRACGPRVAQVRVCGARAIRNALLNTGPKRGRCKGCRRCAEHRGFRQRQRCWQCSRVAAHLQCFAPGGDDATNALGMQTMRGVGGNRQSSLGIPSMSSSHHNNHDYASPAFQVGSHQPASVVMIIITKTRTKTNPSHGERGIQPAQAAV